MNLRKDVITNNTATNSGGGVYNNAGNVNITDSTIAGNTAAPGGTGGGILNDGTLTLVNSTVSGNTATSGGGINNLAGSTNLTSVTVTNNTGGGVLNTTGTVTVANTIIAANVGNTDVTGAFVSNGYNLIGNTSHCTLVGSTGLIGGDPLLGALLQHEGPTMTMALGTNSPAIDAGNPAAPGSSPAACPVIDQRGLPRGGTAGRCDLGAFEVQPSATGPIPQAKKKCKKGFKLVKKHGKKKCKRKKKKKK